MVILIIQLIGLKQEGTPKLPTQEAGSWNYRYWLCYFYVVASEDNTRLQITPSDTTKNGWLPGQTYTVNLNKGEIYNLFGKDNYVSDSQTCEFK